MRILGNAALALALVLVLPATATAAGFNNTTGRVPVVCHESAREIVLLTFGQSISANHGEAAYTPHGKVINFNPNDSHCYVATDPLLGATNNADSHVGSIWGYLCDGLLKTGRWDRCIIAPIAQGSTEMADWAPGGAMNHLIREAVEGLRHNELAPSAILYGQRESDALHADPASYQAKFNQMVADIRSFSTAPILIAVETICYLQNFDLTGVDDATRVAKWIGQEKIAQAQRAVVDPSRGIFPGPYLDYINGREGRWDGCHLSTYGLKAAASQWMYTFSRLCRSWLRLRQRPQHALELIVGSVGAEFAGGLFELTNLDARIFVFLGVCHPRPLAVLALGALWWGSFP